MREIESLPRPARRARRTGGSLAGLRLQDLDLTGHEEALLARTDVEGMVVLGGRISHGPRRAPARARRPGLPDRPAGAGQPLPLDALPAARAVRRAGGARLRGDPRRPGLPLVARRRRPARRLRHAAAGDPRRLGHRRPRRVRRRRADRRASWAATRWRAAPRGSRGARAARPPARRPRASRWSPAAGPARWRRRTSAPSHRTRRRSRMPCERLAAVPSFVPDVGAWARSPWPCTTSSCAAGRVRARG